MKQVFKKILLGLTATPDNRSMMSLINYAKKNELTDNDIADLAVLLSKTGELKRPDESLDLFDIPSTGGPSSLSTLLGPLFLRTLNKKILKIGVPGRPAGGIDSLAQIKGYNINIAPDEINDKIRKFGYLHVITNQNFVPLDGKLFQFRKENQAIAIPSLVIASILSKKIAAGIKNVGLDIRVANFGNFGKTWEEARSNANRFISVSTLLGINSTCFLSKGYIAQQPYIGRTESLLALEKIFQNKMSPSLAKHFGSCGSMAKSLAQSENKTIGLNDIKNAFFENLECQNANKDHFYSIVDETEKLHIHKIKAQKYGYININLEQIRKAITIIQDKFTQIFPDPCGIILNVTDGDLIYKDTLLCTFRCNHKYIKHFREEMEKAFSISISYEQAYELEIVN